MAPIITYVFKMIIIIPLALSLYIVGRLWFLRKKGFGGTSLLREILMAGFAIFCVEIGILTLEITNVHNMKIPPIERIMQSCGVNLVPFRTISGYFGHITGYFWVNIVGNVLMFVPFGLFPPILWKKCRHWYTGAFIGLGTSLIIEFIQLFIGRSVDIDDIILNALGGVIGYLIYSLCTKLFCKRRT